MKIFLVIVLMKLLAIRCYYNLMESGAQHPGKVLSRITSIQ